MKAVLMNSADKLIDDGSVEVNGVPVSKGDLMGMTRTVLKQDGTSTWLDSPAYDDSRDGAGKGTPLDLEMGAGHLNASRALTQFESGEYEPDGADVPIIGWDYGTTSGEGDINRYRFDEQLEAGSFISITLAWDRHVEFQTDGGTQGEYDAGDSFAEYPEEVFDPEADSVINDLNIYLVPKFGASIQTVAQSNANVGTVEHLFFQIPETGDYEFWVEQFDADITGGQDYAVAWWGVGILDGDFDDSGLVDNGDLSLVLNNWGDPVPPTPTGWINQIPTDGFVNNNDLSAVLDNWGNSQGSGSLVNLAVPEPTSALLVIVALGLFGGRAQRKSML